MAALHALDLDVRIWPMPVEVPAPVRFDADTTHCAYDPGRRARSGRRWSRCTRCSSAFAAVSSARAARSISSGAASIWP